MGKLLEQRIPTFFQGVSTQPPSVRATGQVEDAANIDFSVETGGFEGRIGTTVVKEVEAYAGGDYVLHIINRDSTEKYALILRNGQARVIDLADGTEETVTIANSGDNTFFDQDPRNFALQSILDATFIADKTQTVAMNSAPSSPTETYGVVQLEQARESGTYEITIEWNDGSPQSYTGSYSASGSEEAPAVMEGIYNDLTTSPPAGWEFFLDETFIGIKSTNAEDFDVVTDGPVFSDTFVAHSNRVSETSDLLARAFHGHLVEIKEKKDEEGAFYTFDANDGVSGRGIWLETVAPDVPVSFDESTMPRALVRKANGDFELQRPDWKDKKVGSSSLVEPPEFVGSEIKDVVFTKNRLGFLANETAYFSRDSEYYNFWPTSATQSLDTDPFGLTNTTKKVSKFYFGVPFRKSLFVLADEAQFEIHGNLAFTPNEAAIDLATSYPASTECRPVAVGDELYFTTAIGSTASILSYVYEESSVSETATDVSRHVSGFIPANVIELAGDAINQKIWALTDDDRSKLYTHSWYYQKNERVQSAWSRYEFGGEILSIDQVDGKIYLLINYDGTVWLESLEAKTTMTTDFPEWRPRLDRGQFLTGTYDSGTDTTTWDLGYTPSNPAAVTPNDWADPNKFLSLSLTTNGTEVSASGDWSGAKVFLGEKFDAYVELSKQFVREADGVSLLEGRLQLRRMTLRHSQTGYYYVEVTPKARSTKTSRMQNRTLGSSLNKVQNYSVTDGTFRFRVGSRGDTTSIVVGSDGFLPFRITSASWVGFFNEITRQE